MFTNNTVSRSVQQLGGAAWFGGSLMGAVGLNGGAATANNPTERARIASEGWSKWVPVNAVAIGADLLGGVAQLASNKNRIMSQKSLLAMTAGKALFTTAALGATAYARVLGKKIEEESTKSIGAPVEGVTEPSASTPSTLANAQRQEKIMQWAVPALVGANIILNAKMEEQQRNASLLSNVLKRAHVVRSTLTLAALAEGAKRLQQPVAVVSRRNA